MGTTITTPDGVRHTMRRCSACDGSGLREGLYSWHTCEKCEGEGYYPPPYCAICRHDAVLTDGHGNPLCEQCSQQYCCDLCEAQKRAGESEPEVVRFATTPCPPPAEAELADQLAETLELIEAARDMKIGLARTLRIGRAAGVRR